MLTEVVAGLGWWLGAGALMAFAVLGYFEYSRGWCMMRALGFKTPV